MLQVGKSGGGLACYHVWRPVGSILDLDDGVFCKGRTKV